ncbi:hypothetical protein L7F22_047001 [Adiantum nelumboides]|nr:hypothetical protein [Adiantum nelumboides]
MLIYVAHFFTAIVGPSWWKLKMGDVARIFAGFPFISDLVITDFVIFAMMLFAVTPTVSYNVYNVYKVVQQRNGSMTLALAMLFPFFVLISGVTTWAWLSPSDILSTQPHLLLVGTGFAFGYMVGRMILAHLCDEPKGLKTGMCLSLLVLPLAIANALSADILGGYDLYSVFFHALMLKCVQCTRIDACHLDLWSPLIREDLIVISYCLFTMSLYMHFAVSVIHEITNALGIHCFRVGRKEA